jgi:hypothetical protein
LDQSFFALQDGRNRDKITTQDTYNMIHEKRRVGNRPAASARMAHFSKASSF